MKTGLGILAIGFFMAGCNNPSQHDAHQHNNASIAVTASDSLYKAVMHGHDVGMAKMGDIARYKKLLQQQQDSLSGLKVKNTIRIDSLQAAIKDLDHADELMNRWMREFDPDKAGTTEEQKRTYYQQEKAKVDTVTLRINSSVDKAKSLAGK